MHPVRFRVAPTRRGRLSQRVGALFYVGAESFDQVFAAAVVRCKWVVEVDDDEYRVEPKYGGPEYETIGSMGSVCGIDDLRVVAKANQMCNALGLEDPPVPRRHAGDCAAGREY